MCYPVCGNKVKTGQTPEVNLMFTSMICSSVSSTYISGLAFQDKDIVINKQHLEKGLCISPSHIDLHLSKIVLD